MGAVYSIEESYWPQNPRVPIVLRASKYACVKGNVHIKNLWVHAPPAPVLCNAFPGRIIIYISKKQNYTHNHYQNTQSETIQEIFSSFKAKI